MALVFWYAEKRFLWLYLRKISQHLFNRHTFILSHLEKQQIWSTVEKLLMDNQVEASSLPNFSFNKVFYSGGFAIANTCLWNLWIIKLKSMFNHECPWSVFLMPQLLYYLRFWTILLIKKLDLTDWNSWAEVIRCLGRSKNKDLSHVFLNEFSFNYFMP